jgi:Tfp pilus assembly protein PilN
MSAIQFNLLPDVKLAYIKAQRNQKLVSSIAILASAVAIGVFLIMLLTVDVLQKKQLNDAKKSAASASSQLAGISGLSNILTVQNQQKTLVTLHGSKHISSRLFTYLPEVTPTNVNIGRVLLDFKANTIEIDGTADSAHSVNTFVDTLKFTTYKVGSQDSDHPAFTSVVESNFSITAGKASYSLNVTFDPKLFANNLVDSKGNQQAPVLNVPKLTTTRSVTEDPSNGLFNGQFTTPASTNKKTGGQ